MTVVKSFKVYCLPLTKRKTELLKSMVMEYAIFYNYAAKYIPSLPQEYTKPTNPSKLYSLWITSKKKLPLLIGSASVLLAIKDANANHKSSRHNGGGISVIEKPNIIKFANTQYKVVKVNNNYGIQIRIKQNEIYFPLKTGQYTELIARLETMIRNQDTVKLYKKQLTNNRKNATQCDETKNTPKKCKGQKTELGDILYNLRDNSISILQDKIQPPKFKKAKDSYTYIGVDLGRNNVAVFSAIRINDIAQVSKTCHDLHIAGVKTISLKDVPVKVAKVHVMKGFATKHYRKCIIHRENKRRRKRKDVGNDRSNLTNYTSHKISREIVNFAIQFRSPIVIFEKNLANLRNPFWSPADVKSKTEYKLNEKGIWSFDVFAGYTSQVCNHCGAIGIRDSIYFKCEKCGLGIGSNPISTVGQYNADVNASINIALRGLYVLNRKGNGCKETAFQRQKSLLNESSQEGPPHSISEELDSTSIIRDDGTLRKDETPVSVKPEMASAINETVKRSSFQVNEISTVEDHRVDCVPENGFSSCYKEKDNFSGRTERSQKTDIGGVLSKTKFS